MRPGVDVVSRALPAPASPPTNTAIAFIVGPTAIGNRVTLVSSLTEYVALCGTRGSGTSTVTYDAVDVYFREGGGQAYIGSTTQTTLLAEVAGPAQLDADELQKQTRGDLDALAAQYDVDAGAYATKSELIDALVAASDGAEVTPQAVDSGVAAALAALTKDLGPGQVFIADPTLAASPANQSALLAHAAATNRVALLSCTDGNASTLEAIGTALQSDTNARYGALFAPSAIVPGVTPGTTRTVPYPAVEAGIIARNDVVYSPNQPAAGVLGQALYAIDTVNSGTYADSDYAALSLAGVDMARIIYGGVRTYGYRTLVNPTATPEWLSLGNARLNMQIVALAEAIGENFVFANLDGRGITIAQFGGELSAMLAPLFDEGALFGTSYRDAYAVDVGSQVNTPTTIANGELHAVLSVRMSPFAEWVEIEIVKVASNESLPAQNVAVAA
jgi:hypothetical protein